MKLFCKNTKGEIKEHELTTDKSLVGNDYLTLLKDNQEYYASISEERSSICIAKADGRILYVSETINAWKDIIDDDMIAINEVFPKGFRYQVKNLPEHFEIEIRNKVSDSIIKVSTEPSNMSFISDLFKYSQNYDINLLYAVSLLNDSRFYWVMTFQYFDKNKEEWIDGNTGIVREAIGNIEYDCNIEPDLFTISIKEVKDGV